MIKTIKPQRMKSFLWSLFLLFLLDSGFAQGVISGTILDENTAEPLIGANIAIQETGGGVSADLDGKYQISLPSGTYTLTVSYIGYKSKTIEGVESKDKKITYLDLSLSDEALDLDLNVVVKATQLRNSENSVMQLQRKSDKIQDGISSQEMARIGVSDAAGAMKKVSGASVQGGKFIYIRGLGDRYSLSQLNGLTIPSTDPYRNSAHLDLIPANLLDNIITSKTFTPDQPGTFTGGNVNLQTKNFPEQFVLSISMSVGYNAQNNLIKSFLTHGGGSLDWLGYDNGFRSRPDFVRNSEHIQYLNKNAELKARFGDIDYANGIDRIANAFSTQFTPEESRTPFNHSLGISFENQYKLFGKPLGVIFSSSYKKTFEHLGNAQKANWTLFDINSDNLFNLGDFEDTKSSEIPVLNGMLGMTYKFNDYHRIRTMVMYNHHTSKSSRFLFGERPDNIISPEFLEGRALIFNEREMKNAQLSGNHAFPKLNNAKLEWTVSNVYSSQSEPDTRFFTNQYNRDSQTFDIPLSNVEQPFHFFRQLDDNQLDGKIDITIPFNKAGDYKLKFGSLISRKNRNFDEERYQITTSAFAEKFAGNTDEFLRHDNIGIIDFDESRNRYYIGNYLVDATIANNNYQGHDHVNAYYAMISLALFQKLKVIGGARFESTDLFTGSEATSRADSLRIGKIKTKDILPSVNCIFPFTPDMNLRMAYSHTLARPNMRELAPFTSYDPLTKEFYVGNPSLKRTLVKNLDLRWEWFLSPGNLIAVSGYYKHFDHPISLQYLRSSNPEIQFANVKNGKLFGIELEVRKGLGFITPRLDHFKIGSNFSLIRSSLQVNDLTGLEPEDRPFEGQPPYILNAILSYLNPKNGLDFVLSYNQLGDRLNLIGREGTPDIYNRGRSHLDVKVTKKFGNLKLTFSFRNLLNSDYVLSSTYKNKEFIYSKYKKGIESKVGVGITLR